MIGLNCLNLALRGVGAALCGLGFSVLLAASANGQSLEAPAPASPVKILAAHRGMAQHPVDFALLGRAIELRDAGDSPDEVIFKLRERRQRIEGQLRVGREAINEVATSFGTVAGGVAGTLLPLPVGSVVGAVTGGTAASVAVGYLHEREMQARALQARALQERGFPSIAHRPEYAALVRVFDDTDYFEPIWRDLFASRVGFHMTDDDGNPVDDRTAVDSVPILKAQLEEEGIYDSLFVALKIGDELELEIGDDDLGDHELALTNAIRKVSDHAVEIAENHVVEIETVLEERGQSAGEAWAREAKQEAARQARAREAADMANGMAVANLALVGLKHLNPEAAGAMGATFQAMTDVTGALRAYRDSMAVGANSLLATVAVAGNVAGAFMGALNFIGSLQGPSDTEIILNELRGLRDLIANGLETINKNIGLTREEMHGRFDHVDRRLDQVMSDLNAINAAINSALEQIRTEIGGVRVDIEEVKEALDSIDGRLSRVEDLVRESMDMQVKIFANIGQQFDLQWISRIDNNSVLCGEGARARRCVMGILANASDELPDRTLDSDERSPDVWYFVDREKAPGSSMPRAVSAFGATRI